MTQLLQAVILGLLIGGVYALMASGLTLIFGVMNIINVAQGAFLIMVAMFTWWLWKQTGIDPILASVITTPMMFGFGWVLYRTVIVADPRRVAVDVGAAHVRAGPDHRGHPQHHGRQQVQVGHARRTSRSRSASAPSHCPRRRSTASWPRCSCSPCSTSC